MNGPAHRGVAADDPRNAGAIAFFRPKPVTPERIRAQLGWLWRDKTEDDIAARVAKIMADIASRKVRSPPPLSQPLSAVADPWNGLGTHPDIIEVMWRLDDSLPMRCRWVFWGGPALVHPMSGVVFAVGYGTMGYVMRLPEAIRAIATEQQACVILTANPGQVFVIGPAGPEWRFIRHPAPAAAWCRAAYDDAGEDGGPV